MKLHVPYLVVLAVTLLYEVLFVCVEDTAEKRKKNADVTLTLGVMFHIKG